MQPLRILMIEDNLTYAAYVRAQLKLVSPGSDVAHCVLLNEGIAHLRDHACDAVLLDLALPDSDEQGTVKRVVEQAPSVAIVVLTGNEDRRQAIEAVQAGAQEYLVKGPVGGEQLSQHILVAIHRKQLELQAQHYAAELERSNQQLESFTGIVAHDLVAPLRTVTNYLQLLERRYGEQLDEKARSFIEVAVKGATHMAELIKDIRKVSRVSANRDPLERMESATAAAQAISNLEMAIEDKQAAVHVEQLPTVTGDPLQLTQLFQNLIQNALKYSTAERPPEISITATPLAGQWQFAVTDNGIGMESRHLERIFEIFQRLHTADEYSGSGIGLTICQRIIQRHNGRIWATSEPGAGSTFYFTLPMASPEPAVEES